MHLVLFLMWEKHKHLSVPPVSLQGVPQIAELEKAFSFL